MGMVWQQWVYPDQLLHIWAENTLTSTIDFLSSVIRA